MEEARLYVIPGSHPSMAARLMLESKGVPYRRVDLMPVVAKALLRGMRFPRKTVPAMKVGGSRVQGTGEIARELDRLVPEPLLLPPNEPAGRRAAVEEAERFGDRDLQPPVRSILWWCLKRDREPLRSFSEGARLGIPIGLALRTAGPIVAGAARLNEATDENVRRSLAAMPAMLRRVEEWIESGVLGGPHPNVADFQVATSLRLAMTLDDLRPAIESRPAGKLALRLVPDYPGRVPPVLPPAWLQPLRSEAVEA